MNAILDARIKIFLCPNSLKIKSGYFTNNFESTPDSALSVFAPGCVLSILCEKCAPCFCETERLAFKAMLNSDIQTISNRYRILDKIDEGGMGAVYRATDRLTGHNVALKQVVIKNT